MISIITNSQQDDDTKRFRSNSNCSVVNLMLPSNNVSSFNNLSRNYSINPHTPAQKEQQLRIQSYFTLVFSIADTQ